MTTRVRDTVRNAAVDAATGLLNAGATAAELRIYTGTQPAGGPSATATGTLLVVITLNDPVAPAAAAGVGTFDVSPVPAGVAVSTGTAGWARLLDSNGVALIDETVGATGSGERIVLNPTAIVAGAEVSVTALTLTQAASA